MTQLPRLSFCRLPPDAMIQRLYREVKLFVSAVDQAEHLTVVMMTHRN